MKKQKKRKEINVRDVPRSNLDTKVHHGSIEFDKDTKIYTNPYFDLEIKIPGHWISLDHDELINIALEKFEKLNISDAEINKILEVMTTNSISLFSATPFPKGTKQPYGKNQRLDNPSINCTAQKAIMFPNNTSSDFIQGTIEQLKSGSMGFKYEEFSNVNSVIISGKRFDSFEGKAFINNRRDIVYTRFYSILKKGYQLSIITSCLSEDGSKDLSEIINNLTLDKF